MREIPPGLRELRGAPLAILYALKWAAAPVSLNWLLDATGYDDSKTIKKSMRLLRRMGLATYRGETYCTDCQLTGSANQLPLGFELADQTETDAVDPAPLQAGVPLDDAVQPSVNSRKNSDSSVLIVLKESDSLIDSFKNNYTGNSRKNSDSTESRRGAAHLSSITAALLRKGAPRPVEDDPFDPDLRAAVQRLVTMIHLSRKRAEQAIARSPWLAPKILEQIEIWLSYRQSPAGTNLDDGKFPWLVAARIESGEECPRDTRGADALSRYDGYLPYINRSEFHPSEGEEQDP